MNKGNGTKGKRLDFLRVIMLIGSVPLLSAIIILTIYAAMKMENELETGFVVPWNSPSLSGALLCDSFDGLIGVASSNLPDGKTILVMWYQFPSAYRSSIVIDTTAFILPSFATLLTLTSVMFIKPSPFLAFSKSPAYVHLHPAYFSFCNSSVLIKERIFHFSQ